MRERRILLKMTEWKAKFDEKTEREREWDTEKQMMRMREEKRQRRMR